MGSNFHRLYWCFNYLKTYVFNLWSKSFIALYQVVTKKVSEDDTNETSLFYTSIIGLIIMTLLATNFWTPIESSSYIMFLAIGIFFSLGLYLQIIALSKARASILQPFHYTLIFWAIIFGYIFYNDVPDMFTIVGAIIITASGIFVLNHSSKLIRIS